MRTGQKSAVRAGPGLGVLCLAVLLTAAGCGGDEPLATPPTAGDAASSYASASPSASPSPLSAFEADPAVQGLRANLAAVAEAVNQQNLQLPALLATTTARRAGVHQEVYGPEFGNFYPGPNPTAVLGVQVISETQRNVLVCTVENGFVLDRPGGTPVKPYAVAGGQFELLLQDGLWKVNRAVAADEVSCQGVPIPGVTP